MPVARLLAKAPPLSNAVDAAGVRAELAGLRASAAAARNAACQLACRTLDLGSREGCLAALQAVGAPLPRPPPQRRRSAKAQMSLAEMAALTRDAAAVGNSRAERMLQLLSQLRQAQDRASQLDHLFVEVKPEGSNGAPEQTGCTAFVVARDFGEQDTESMLVSSLGLAGAGLEISRHSVHDELLSGVCSCHVCPPLHDCAPHEGLLIETTCKPVQASGWPLTRC